MAVGGFFNLRIIAGIISTILASATSGQVQAQSMLEIAAGIKFCKTLTDDAQRLKCFDGLFTEKQQQPPAAKSQPELGWSIEESKSPIDDSPQVTGMLRADGSTDGPSLTPPTMLVLRCQEKKTEAYLTKPLIFLGTDPIKVLVRINDGKPIETQWHPSTNGQGVFAPAAVQFIRALPENGKLFIRATGFNGENVDGAFTLGRISEIRDKIAADCHWPAVGGPTEASGAKKDEAPARRVLPQKLSQSEVDALRLRILSCWSPSPGINANSEVYVVLRVLFKADGSLLQAPVLVEGSASPLGPALVESVKRALMLCQPFTMLKPEHYDQWKDIQLRFDPHELLGG